MTGDLAISAAEARTVVAVVAFEGAVVIANDTASLGCLLAIDIAAVLRAGDDALIATRAAAIASAIAPLIPTARAREQKEGPGEHAFLIPDHLRPCTRRWSCCFSFRQCFGAPTILQPSGPFGPAVTSEEILPRWLRCQNAPPSWSAAPPRVGTTLQETSGSSG